MKTRHVSCVVVLSLIGLVSACEINLGKNKDSYGGPRDARPRVRNSPEWNYRQAFSVWRINHETMVEQLEQATVRRNNLMIMKAAEDAGTALATMMAFLPEGKAKELEPMIDEYFGVGKKAMEGVNSHILVSKLRTHRRVVTGGFDPDIVPIVAPREE